MSDLNIPLHITEVREEAQDCRSILFEKPGEVTYEPGDWMDIRFPTPEFPVGRTYSFTSAPTEHHLQITYKKGVSPFKRRLESATPGETMLITQYGTNGFRLDRRYRSLFIAGGVGITPFRSMIKALIDTGAEANIEVVYQNHTDDFPFTNELDAWRRAYPCLKVHYVATGIERRLTEQTLLRLLLTIRERQAMYYIAGSPGMVDRAEKILVEIGVDHDDIKTDRFDGF